jgi:hypothetical protein
MKTEMRKHIDKFNNFVNEGFFDKKVELDIVDVDKEEIVTSIIVKLDTAKKIADALYKDRKDGGRYRGVFDESRVI